MTYNIGNLVRICHTVQQPINFTSVLYTMGKWRLEAKLSSTAVRWGVKRTSQNSSISATVENGVGVQQKHSEISLQMRSNNLGRAQLLLRTDLASSLEIELPFLNLAKRCRNAIVANSGGRIFIDARWSDQFGEAEVEGVLICGCDHFTNILAECAIVAKFRSLQTGLFLSLNNIAAVVEASLPFRTTAKVRLSQMSDPAFHVGRAIGRGQYVGFCVKTKRLFPSAAGIIFEL